MTGAPLSLVGQWAYPKAYSSRMEASRTGSYAGWDFSESNGVDVTETTRARSGAYALQVRYQRSGSQPSQAGVTQTSVDCQARGTPLGYILRQTVWTENLSRQVVFGFQFLYQDGSSQYVGGSTRTVRTN